MAKGRPSGSADARAHRRARTCPALGVTAHSLAIEWDCEWITLDRDYARFPGLRWGLPTVSSSE